MNLTVFSTSELTTEQQTQLETLINDYVDPEYYLHLSRTNTLPLFSSWTSDPNQTKVGDKSVMQTYIYDGNSVGQDPAEILDAVKSIFEYRVDNVQHFANTTEGNVYFEIYDVTRDRVISTRTIPLGSIAQSWNQLAQTGYTGGSTLYRTELFQGMMNASPGYDCIWQFRGDVTPPEIFDFRVNSYQELYYNKLFPNN
jgi:hypothetical protein